MGQNHHLGGQNSLELHDIPIFLTLSFFFRFTNVNPFYKRDIYILILSGSQCDNISNAGLPDLKKQGCHNAYFMYIVVEFWFKLILLLCFFMIMVKNYLRKENHIFPNTGLPDFYAGLPDCTIFNISLDLIDLQP